MNAHGDDRHLVCPHCLKRFETRQGVKAHMKMKRHTLHHDVPEPWAKYAVSPRNTPPGGTGHRANNSLLGAPKVSVDTQHDGEANR